MGEFDISKLRQDVLRQVTASLASFIGSVSYSAHGHEAMVARSETEKKREAFDKSQICRYIYVYM